MLYAHSYQIVRVFNLGPAKIIKTGLTLEEAQAQCKNKHGIGRTCKNKARRAVVREPQYFDAYEQM